MEDARSPWRLCPPGHHWVKPYARRFHRGDKSGAVAVRGHCASNPSKKDVIGPDEIHEIARRHFGRLTGPPKNDRLGFRNGNRFNLLIRGRTRYWNEVLAPDLQLDPNLVKALIGSESGFDPSQTNHKKGKKLAVGLMQITVETLGILQNEKGELRDHLFRGAKRPHLDDPAFNICAGIRWLFRKRQTASAKLNRAATWQEAVLDFKAALEKPPAKQERLMKNFLGYYSELQRP